MEQCWQNAANCRSRVLKRLIENALLPVVYVICNLFHMLMFTCISKTRLIVLQSTHSSLTLFFVEMCARLMFQSAKHNVYIEPNTQ